MGNAPHEMLATVSEGVDGSDPEPAPLFSPLPYSPLLSPPSRSCLAFLPHTAAFLCFQLFSFHLALLGFSVSVLFPQDGASSSTAGLLLELSGPSQPALQLCLERRCWVGLCPGTRGHPDHPGTSLAAFW